MCVCVLIPYLFLAIFLILHIHGGPLTLYMNQIITRFCHSLPYLDIFKLKYHPKLSISIH